MYSVLIVKKFLKRCNTISKHCITFLKCRCRMFYSTKGGFRVYTTFYCYFGNINMSVDRIRRVTLCHPWGKNVMAKIQNGRHPDTTFPTTSLLDHIKANCCGKIYVCLAWETIKMHNHTDGVLVYITITPKRCFAHKNTIFASTYFIFRSTRMACM